jgi:hypothetical protein
MTLIDSEKLIELLKSELVAFDDTGDWYRGREQGIEVAIDHINDMVGESEL